MTRVTSSFQRRTMAAGVPAGGEEADPVVDLEAGKRLADGREIGRRGGARGADGGDGAELPGLGVRQHWSALGRQKFLG